MRYSNYTLDQISSTKYDEVAQKLLTLTKNEDIKGKMTRYIKRRWV